MHSEPFLMVHPERFLEDVLEQPHADDVRLRYADWLDEHGEALGEFIRVQCRLARLPVNHISVPELEYRENQLRAEHEREWAGDLKGMVDWYIFRRGFVEEISIAADRFVANACSLFHRAPIQEIHLRNARDCLDTLTGCPYLQRIGYLDLSNNQVRDYGAKLLAGSTHLSHLHGLNLGSAGIGDSGLKALAASPYLTELRDLYLSDNRITNNGIRAFVRSPLAQRLHGLHLQFNSIGPEGVCALQENMGDRVHL